MSLSSHHHHQSAKVFGFKFHSTEAKLKFFFPTEANLKFFLPRDKVFQQQKIYADLKKNIENLDKNGVTHLRSLVNIGSEVYAQANVPDTRHIFVDVGLGFHVEFTWSEAVQFISVKEAKLLKEIEDYTNVIASIKA